MKFKVRKFGPSGKTVVDVGTVSPACGFADLHAPIPKAASGITLTIVVVLNFICASAPAAVRLPLDGYCRPGRYFPIEIDSQSAISFSANGALTTDVAAGSNPRAIIPMLVLGTPTDLHWPGGSLPLRVPGIHERLIASTSNTIDVPDLFPGDRLLPIHLDIADPLPGPPAAWEALDAVVLDAGEMARITAAQRSALLAAGVMLTVPGKTKPDEQWPWQLRRVSTVPFWVLSFTPRGPIDQPTYPEVYAPTYGWSPGWPPAVRTQVAAAAAVLFLAIMAISLLRNRWVIVGLIALSLSAAGAIAGWQKSFGTIDRAGGAVIVGSSNLIQHDEWMFERGRQDGEQIVSWDGSTHPIFGSDVAVAQSRMKITVPAYGTARFEFYLDHGKTIALMRREVRPGSLPKATNSNSSPMRELVKAAYLQSRDRITGEIPAAGESWPGVVINKDPER